MNPSTFVSTSACADEPAGEKVPPSPRTPAVQVSRKARAANMYSSSLLRPEVPAHERMARWTTPFAIDTRIARISETSAEATSTLFRVALQSLDKSSLKNYGAGLLRFTQFCDKHGVDEFSRMPASDSLLSSFIASHSGNVARTTIDTWIAGLSFWHSLNGASWQGGKLLRTICKGAAKLQPKKTEMRAPVTLAHLHALLNHLDMSNSFDAAVFAVATFGFWGCRRCANYAKLFLPNCPFLTPIFLTASESSLSRLLMHSTQKNTPCERHQSLEPKHQTVKSIHQSLSHGRKRRKTRGSL